jgi:hypothetical protein
MKIRRSFIVNPAHSRYAIPAIHIRKPAWTTSTGFLAEYCRITHQFARATWQQAAMHERMAVMIPPVGLKRCFGYVAYAACRSS